MLNVPQKVLTSIYCFSPIPNKIDTGIIMISINNFVGDKYQPGAHLVTKSGGKEARRIDAGLGAIDRVLSFLGEIVDFPNQDSVVGSGLHQLQASELIGQSHVF